MRNSVNVQTWDMHRPRWETPYIGSIFGTGSFGLELGAAARG